MMCITFTGKKCHLHTAGSSKPDHLLLGFLNLKTFQPYQNIMCTILFHHLRPNLANGGMEGMEQLQVQKYIKAAATIWVARG